MSTARTGAAEAGRLARAARLLGHDFADPTRLSEALTHRSALQGRARSGAPSNERLEFIGDRVLGLLTAEWLLERFPAEAEGALALRLARLVSRAVLADIAGGIGLAELLTIAPNETAVGVHRLSTVLADGMEAALGALFLDGGLDAARRFVRSAWASAMAEHTLPPKDPKTALQERVVALGHAAPAYSVASREGPSHAPHFVVVVEAGSQQGRGEGGTKRGAERAAAADLLGRIGALTQTAAASRAGRAPA